MATFPKKILIITHDAGNYGASRSLQLLTSNWNDAIIDLIVARRIIGGFDMRDIRRRFSVNVRNIFKLHLPIDYCYRGKPRPSFILKIYQKFLKLLWRIDRFWFERLLKEGNYDLVHLNSLTLHELLSPRYPCTIHIREIFDGSSNAAIASLQKALGIIFIDNATRAPFLRANLPFSTILNNPVDMTSLSSYSISDAGHPGLDPRNHTIFAVIGKFTSDKGVEFIIKAFRKVRNDHIRLLLVGSGDPASVFRAKREASGDERIIFWGEEPDILKIYRISDYILRGEPYFCVGRTVYEGLYAGASVIIPGSQATENTLFEIDKFIDRIHFYTPRNDIELTTLLSALADKKIQDRAYESNTNEYVRLFKDFVAATLSNHDHSSHQNL